MFGLVALAYMWARMAKISSAKLANGGGDRDFHERKVALGRFFMAKTLPETSSLLSTITAGADTLMALDADLF